MRNVDKIKKRLQEQPLRDIHWKKRPSELRGFQRTLYLTTDEGDYLRVDYNLNENRVRLFVEDNSEGGIPYYAVINQGKPTIERNAATGRATNVADRIRRRSEVFSTIPNRKVMKMINNNYGIGFGISEIEEKRQKRQQQLETTRKRYFKAEYIETGYDQRSTASGWRIGLKDVLDLLIGSVLCYGAYIYDRSLIDVSIVAGTIGILLGIIDIFIRGRDPVILKVLIFVISGAVFYVLGYYIY